MVPVFIDGCLAIIPLQKKHALFFAPSTFVKVYDTDEDEQLRIMLNYTMTMNTTADVITKSNGKLVTINI
jgi:hypothetical protein